MTMTRQLRVVIPGGSGQVGTILAQHFHADGHHVTVLARSKYAARWPVVMWNGTTLGNWTSTLDSADVLINCLGRRAQKSVAGSWRRYGLSIQFGTCGLGRR